MMFRTAAFAQHSVDTSSRNQTSQLYIETDPTAWFYNGFSLVLRRSSTFHQNLNLGLGVYKVTLPEFYIESVESNKGKGWTVDNFGIDVFSDYFLFDPNKGLSLGLHLGWYHYELERLNEESSYQSLVETLRIGYLWRPIKQVKSLYVYPWAGISTGQKISGSNEIEGASFETPQWSFVPSIQIGVSF